jgi:acyl-CoA hydrolase
MANVDQETYQSKLISQKDFIARLRPGNYLHFGVWYGQPYGVLRALAEHGQGLAPLYISNAYATGAWGYFDAPCVACVTSFFGPYERQAQRAHDNVFYIPMQYTDGQRLIREGAPFDYYVFRAAPMDERGYFNCSLTSSWEYGAIRHIHEAGRATKVVIEVNARLPRVHGLPEFGDNELHVSYADIIVEDDSPLLEFPTPPPTETEQAIARNVAQLVRDGDTLQLGFGGIPMAIGRLLKDRRELGIHSEMLCEAHLDLIESGSVTNAHKGLYDGLSVCTFALGEKRMHDWARENRALAMLPVEEINSMRVLSRVRRMASVNSILTIDLTGQACAHCLGPTTYSGLGGAFEFAYGAQLSPGGRSILCLPSQARLKDGSEVSNVVARHPPGTRVTVPEHCTDWVVTEYGAARLKFLNLEQRAAALIEIAHPKYREELSRQAVANGLRLSRIKGMPIPSEHLLRSED